MTQSQLKQLTAKWYAKLAKEGFQDIESHDAYDNLKVWASQLSRPRVVTKFESTQEYYRMAGHFLHDYTFKSARDKLCWQLHSEGKTGIAIEKILSSRKFPVIKQRHIANIILGLSKIMKEFYHARA